MNQENRMTRSRGFLGILVQKDTEEGKPNDEKE